jgi:2,3-bisphosphoglycerate-independent phosphoglycerate mutase
MKYIILIGDGMGDYPIPELGGRTPLEAAATPNLDSLVRRGFLGRAATTPPGLAPGSDVAIMSLMGYNPKGVLTGRGPLEAAALKVALREGDLAFRLNLVTLEFGPETIMRSHSAGDISSPEAGELLEALAEKLPLGDRTIHQGVSYRNLLVWPGCQEGLPSVPPHDFRDQPVDKFFRNPALAPIMDLVRDSWPILTDHPVNRRRREQNLPAANSIWLWGQGRSPQIRTYQERWGLKGATVSAVDIIRGLALYTGLTPLAVPGATGLLDTNYQGKVEAGLDALGREGDLVIIHLEAPDEMSHQGDLAAKLKAIENFDRLIAGPVLQGLETKGPYRLLAACDHYTPLKLRTHAADPVPFVLFDSQNPAQSGFDGFSEKNALAAGYLAESGPALGRLFFGPERNSA